MYPSQEGNASPPVASSRRGSRIGVWWVAIALVAAPACSDASGDVPLSSVVPPELEQPDVAIDHLSRCRMGGGLRAANGAGHRTLAEALATAAAAAGVSSEDLRRESNSEVWIAGPSDDPGVLVELRQPDSVDAWFVDVVMVCTEGSADAVPTTLADTPAALSFRILVEGAAVGDFGTDVATSSQEWDAMWLHLGLAGDPTPVDFATSVVFYFGIPESGSCPFGPVKHLVFDSDLGVVYPEVPVVIPAGTDACTQEAKRHAILVEVKSADLPAGGFSLWYTSQYPPGEQMAVVEAGEFN